jgi:hypothetical protein
MQLTDDVDRRSNLTRADFAREYSSPLAPVILTDALSHWRALGRWSPQFFRADYGHLEVQVDGERVTLRELVDRVEASSEDHPAPYLRNQPLAELPPELTADVSPLPECTQPNWLQSRFFPARGDLSALELYIGGRGAKFPVMHYDRWHTHAFLMQLYGEKEYLVFSPKHTAAMYPRDGGNSNLSQLDDLDDPDLTKFPLLAYAQGKRFRLGPGEMLFVPAGWWHTARILSPSVTVSINVVNRANSLAFRKDYCADMAQRSKLRSHVAHGVLVLGEATRVFAFR